MKLNNRHLTLKLLCMIKILSILDKDTKYICVRDAIDTLDIPHVLALEIAHEHEYQIDLYFHIVIEPYIAYILSKSILDIIHVSEIYHT